MKKLVSLLLVLLLVSFGISSNAAKDGQFAKLVLRYELYQFSEACREEIVKLTDEQIRAGTYKFKDLDNHRLAYNVGRLAALSIIEPDKNGLFRPKDGLKIHEFAEMILKIFDKQCFSPDKSKYVSAATIINAAMNEFDLIEEGDFSNYNKTLTREEVAKMIMRVTLPGEKISSWKYHNFANLGLEDYTGIGKNYRIYVLYACCLGIMSPLDGNKFEPKKAVTREEAAEILIRYLDKRERKPLTVNYKYGIELIDGVNIMDLPYKPFYYKSYVKDPRELTSDREIPNGYMLWVNYKLPIRSGNKLYEYAIKSKNSEENISVVELPYDISPKGYEYWRTDILVGSIHDDMSNIQFSLEANPLKGKIKSITKEEIETAKKKFDDITNHWGADYIAKLYSLGVIDGYGNNKFGPEDTLKVDEFLKMILNAMGHKIQAGETYWAEPYVAMAKEEGLIKEGEFSDYRRPLLREEAVGILMRAMFITEYIPPDNHRSYAKYRIADLNDISEQYKEYVASAYCYGLVTGANDNKFLPKKTLTRAEGSTLIIRALDEYSRKPTRPSKEEAIVIDDSIRTYAIYPYKDNIMLMNIIRDIINLSKSYSNLSELWTTLDKDYSSISVTFFEDETKKRGNSEVFSFSVYFGSNRYAFDGSLGAAACMMVFLKPDIVKQKYMNVLTDVSKKLFGAEYEKFLRKWESYAKIKYFETNVQEETFYINGKQCLFQPTVWSCSFRIDVKIN